ncbi:hypothetical protein EV421DRAFT_1755305 [Armillaria borealis]|uniref:ubiquitinyl hydrolase 1 n=1 Tax=Armillaria borealis TaxID=47425 RepID=A0AA39N3J9_9AGAR|nr:hypothetical protein EV421DRAFT_1755305 [Armillaria borealis]
MDDTLLNYIINHVFLPPILPQEDDRDEKHESGLCSALLECVQRYQSHLDDNGEQKWSHILKMLQNFELSLKMSLSLKLVYDQLSDMACGDILLYHINAQNAAVIFRREEDDIVFECFEVMFPNDEVMGTVGKLVSSFPGPAVAFPVETFDKPVFRKELANFLVEMHKDCLDGAASITRKAGRNVMEEREAPHPHYISQLLRGILYGLSGGRSANVRRFSKRIDDVIMWNNAKLPWRRSPIWLVLRVALQSTLFEGGDHVKYKTFITFFIAHIVTLGTSKELASDTLDVMRKKMCRRLAKLASAPEFLHREVKTVNNGIDQILQQRWSAIQHEQQNSSPWNPLQLDISADTTITLPRSISYIREILRPVVSTESTTSLHLNHLPRLRYTRKFSSFTAERLQEAFDEDQYLALADFEQCVAKYLDDFVSGALHQAETSSILSICIDRYAKAAQDAYRSNPEDESIMLLTLLDLWVALDKVAIVQCPLLAEYSHGIPMDLLGPVLLRHSQSIGRLLKIYEYFRQRQLKITHNESLFDASITPDSFAVQYFNASATLQNLKLRIEANADAARARKLEELAMKTEQYNDLRRQADELEHTYFIPPWAPTRKRHDRNCQKCSFEKQAKSIVIKVHEHPLPALMSMSKMVVFELACPDVIHDWRETTYTLLHDIFSPSSNQCGYTGSPAKLGSYSPLQPYISGKTGRMTLASTTKSFLSTHYRSLTFPTDEDQVCLPCGLTYKLYDSSQDTWISNPSSGYTIRDRCTLQLSPDGLYDMLQYAVRDTTHTPNHVIAHQFECPIGLTLHEYEAFAGLRAGERLQWLNISRELRARILTFNRESVHTLLMQSAWQIGVVTEGTLEWHADLCSPSFQEVLLEELLSLLLSVEGNWLESVTVRTIVLLTSRLLAAVGSSDEPTVGSAYSLLRRARSIAFEWVQKLVAKLQRAVDDEVIQDLQLRIFELAATARLTYDVDPGHLTSLLRTQDDVMVFIACAIFVHDNVPPEQGSMSPHHWRLFRRDQRLAHFVEPFLRKMVHGVIFQQGLDGAITRIWPAYRANEWTTLNSPNHRWITTTTAVETGQTSQDVHLNLLTGLLLIDSRQLGRLPYAITSDSIYKRTFGSKIIDVIPSDLPGAQYASRCLISGWQIFLGLKNCKLIIRAKKPKEGDIFEQISHTEFEGDLPQFLVDDYAAWINLRTADLELRPLVSMWVTSPRNWHMSLSSLLMNPSSLKPTLTDGSREMIDIHSQTFEMISFRLQNFEECHYIHITRSRASGLRVQVDLPRFHLSFFLNNENELECHNLPNMVIDENQSPGTFFGLDSRLVICFKDNFQQPMRRHVLIPHGEVHSERRDHHVKIVIDKGTDRSVAFHEYQIDDDMGRLVSNAGLTSTLYQALLHALSSHCLADPLTGLTGTEEAIHILQSATCFSFQNISDSDLNVLRKISGLTPNRAWYPKHLKTMQTVHWCYTYSSLGQHYGFHNLAQKVLDYAKLVQLFDDRPGPSLDLEESGPRHLLDRAALRLSCLYPVDSSCFDHQDDDCDAIHISRDQEGAEEIASNVSRMIEDQSFKPTSQRYPTLQSMIIRWNAIGPGDEKFTLSYQRFWLSSEYLAKNWLSYLYLNYTSSKSVRRWQALFSMSAMAYGDPDFRDMIPPLLALAVCSHKTLSSTINSTWCSRSYTSQKSFDLSEGHVANEGRVKKMVHEAVKPEDRSPIWNMQRHDEESDFAFDHRRTCAHQTLCNKLSPELIQQIMPSWSTEKVPQAFDVSQFSAFSAMFELNQLLSDVGSYFWNCYHNDQLLRATSVAQDAINDILSRSESVRHLMSYDFAPCQTRPPSRLNVMSLSQLLSNRNANFIHTNANSASGTVTFTARFSSMGAGKSASSPFGDNGQLSQLINEFKNCSNELKHLYGRELEESHKSFKHQASASSSSTSIPLSTCRINTYRDKCRKAMTDWLVRIEETLLIVLHPCEKALQYGGLWPRITPRSILCQITDDSDAGEWKFVMKTYAFLYLEYQWAQRLLYSAISQDYTMFYKEISNNQVKADEYPEWILLQVDNDFLSRPIQVDVAHAIISPPSGMNSVLQLNMGEGKSSVIVPMVAVATADGRSITRVVVLKSLARQMFQLLVQRITRLVNRRVFYMPFSRKLSVGSKEIETIRTLYHQCIRERGVLVIQPEHILSFKLMCVNQLADNNDGGEDVASQLLELQAWLDEHVRDILDESDEILHVRYQLIYTIGAQRSLEGHTDRWTTIQQILALVTNVISSVKDQCPHSVELRPSTARDGSFPFIRIYSSDSGDPDAGERLISSICAQILSGNLKNYSLAAYLPDNVRVNVQRFIRDVNVEPNVTEYLQEQYLGTDTWTLLLLLRGLLGHGILVYILKQRRHRVDYGLDLSRTLLAVPYRAKDMPSLAAEFGHPDVAITLTCLSYYYAGLTDEQVDICFELLFKEDDPSIEVMNPVPQQLRYIIGVNMKDMEQRSNYLRPLFRHNHAVIDFFLSRVVFPKHAKEFPQKISTSGWDLAAERSKCTTGFSGTNDNRHLLPLSIQQYDPVEQQGTNAKVLDCLLRPENNHYKCSSSSLTTEKFLRLLVKQDPEIRVLLDVGAQMLDLRNEELAKLWLSLRPASVSAAIYFDDADELMVLDRDGIAKALFLSPFKYQLDKCVVYLDEAHTRGTDLKLPIHFRAAVTLGANVTKDRLVQGAMRMRQLGQGQSVMFFAPREIDSKIRKAARKSKSAQVEAVDILRWSMLETCNEIAHRVPQWAQQGYDYKRRQEAWDSYLSSDKSSEILSPWLQPESRSLQELYGPSDGPAPGLAIWQDNDLRKRCEMLGVSFVSETNMDEEQEREVSHEVEREQQVERPAKASPAQHSLHPDVRTFVLTGTIEALSTAFKPLFRAFDGISPALSKGERIWAPNLFCTQDFATTIKTSKRGQNVTDYLRSINWIISANRNEDTILVVLSPFEVNELLAEIRTSTNVHLHIYSPKVNVSTNPFDDLQFHCIPSPNTQIDDDLLIAQLNTFAGQLYLRDYEKYRLLCSFLGLYQGQRSTNVPISDGFVKPEYRGDGDISPFATSPVPFLKALLGSRRKGHPYLATHLGKILHGGLLTSKSFD